MDDRVYCVYIVSNTRRTVLYTGVTSKLKQRIRQHKEKLVDGFTRRHNTGRLVYYECCAEPLGAIAREKHIEAGSRQKKIQLIERMNPEWRDLYDDL